jgi:hypothetical protein
MVSIVICAKVYTWKKRFSNGIGKRIWITSKNEIRYCFGKVGDGIITVRFAYRNKTLDRTLKKTARWLTPH